MSHLKNRELSFLEVAKIVQKVGQRLEKGEGNMSSAEVMIESCVLQQIVDYLDGK
tara:strand:- start:326 stop:490 length:165 start_codon:yes stop_codon:yes gene_type:complete